MVAKLLIALSVVIVSSSVYVGRKAHDANLSLTGKVVKATSAEGQAKRSLVELESVLTSEESKAEPLDKALPAATLWLTNSQVEYAITVVQANPAKTVGAGGVSPINDLAEVVPGTSLKSARINVKGTYQNYDGFVTFLRELTAVNPASIVFLKVQNNAFEVGIRIYGV